MFFQIDVFVYTLYLNNILVACNIIRIARNQICSEKFGQHWSWDCNERLWFTTKNKMPHMSFVVSVAYKYNLLVLKITFLTLYTITLRLERLLRILT